MTNKNKDSAKVGNGNVTVGNGNVTGDKSAETGDKSAETGDKCVETDDISIETNDKDTASDDKGTASDDKGAASDDKDAASDDKGTASDDKGTASDDKDTASDDKDAASDDKDAASDDKGEEIVDKGEEIVDKGEEIVDKGIAKENKDYPLKDFYKKIYGRYDLVNRIFTFGQDRNWRKQAVEECLGNAPLQVLDICTGTGDLVLEMAEKAGRTGDPIVENSANEVAQGKDLPTQGLSEKPLKGKRPIAKEPSEKDEPGKGPIAKAPTEKAASAVGPAIAEDPANVSATPIQYTGYDFSAEMLKKAREKAAAAGAPIDFIEGNVAEMPFADNRFDTAGITFGIRNLIYENSNADRHLAEIHRVLRMNGRLVVLESSRPDSRIWRFVNGIYLQFILPWLGGLISGNLKAYRYLAKSSKNYYSRKEMAGILERAGFRVIRSRPLFLGSVMLLVAEKQAKAD